jgi:hypothetical protein
VGGPIVHNRFFFFSDETTRQRTFGGNPLLPGPRHQRRVLLGADGGAARWRLFGNRDGHLRPDDGQRDRRGAGAVCSQTSRPGSTTDPRFAACNYIPPNRINPIAAAMLSKLVTPTLAGFTNNYFLTTGYDSTYHKIDGKLTYTVRS